MENPHLEALPKQEKKEEKRRKKNLKLNLCKGKQIAVEDLGGVLVIVDGEKYINEASRQLSDKRNYKTLQEDLKRHNRQV